MAVLWQDIPKTRKRIQRRVSSAGAFSMVVAGDTSQVLGRNALGEPIIDTPAISDDKLYMRTAGHLWAFGK